MVSLSTYLRRHRLTHQELADQLGISRVMVTMLANGTKTPSLSLAIKLHIKTGIPVTAWKRRAQ